MADWNWFFSALPQCAAAIVGLGGAFLVTKIVNNEAAYSQNVALAHQLLDEAMHLQDRLRARYFHWYNKHSRRTDSNRFWKKIKEAAEPLLTAEQYYAQGSFSPFIPRDEILHEIRETMRLARRPPPPRRRDLDLMTLAPTAASITMDQQLATDLQSERERIDQLIVDVDLCVRRVKRLHGTLASNPQSSPLVARAVALTLALFFVGVIYPLGWLPVTDTPDVSISPADILDTLASFRGALLLAFSSIFATSMALFARTNAALRYPASLLEQLAQRSTRASYSDYLRIMDENEAASFQAVSEPPAEGVA